MKNGSEIVFGLICPIGTDTADVIQYLCEHLRKFEYDSEIVTVSKDVLTRFGDQNPPLDEYSRILHYIELGNSIREKTGDNSILMKGVASEIMRNRHGGAPHKNKAIIIKSIKTPEEANFLRSVYGVGFHLIGITSSYARRMEYFTQRHNISEEQAKNLLSRDANEDLKYGQHTQNAFQHADYFIEVTDSTDKLKNSIYRLVDLLFGDPFITPNFDEHAMFLAYASSLRSADLSRQIGAIIAKNNEVLASGTNDCPKAFGGLYWPISHPNGRQEDITGGRDYTLGYDSNKIEQMKIIRNIFSAFNIEASEENILRIKGTGIGDITEYGRVVHAEMEALMMASRNSISTCGATLYATTFPCHNCAKHIIAAGIKEVVYIEPYPKSKALEFYQNEVTELAAEAQSKVLFRPFVGVGPHRYVDLFSYSSYLWSNKVRKNSSGNKVEWEREKAVPRVSILDVSYIEAEKFAHKNYEEEIIALGGKIDE